MQFIEAPLQAQQRNKIPQRIFDNCKALGQLSSGNAAGHQDPNDLTGLPQGPFIKKSQEVFFQIPECLRILNFLMPWLR